MRIRHRHPRIGDPIDEFHVGRVQRERIAPREPPAASEFDGHCLLQINFETLLPDVGARPAKCVLQALTASAMDNQVIRIEECVHPGGFGTPQTSSGRL